MSTSRPGLIQRLPYLLQLLSTSRIRASLRVLAQVTSKRHQYDSKIEALSYAQTLLTVAHSLVHSCALPLLALSLLQFLSLPLAA